MNVDEIKTTQELVDYLNSFDIQQQTHWEEDIPEEIWKAFIKDNIVVYNLHVDPHRWYETAIDVFNPFVDSFIGVRHVNKTYSEMQDIDSICWTLQFFEMEEITTVTYKKID